MNCSYMNKFLCFLSQYFKFTPFSIAIFTPSTYPFRIECKSIFVNAACTIAFIPLSALFILFSAPIYAMCKILSLALLALYYYQIVNVVFCIVEYPLGLLSIQNLSEMWILGGISSFTWGYNCFMEYLYATTALPLLTGLLVKWGKRKCKELGVKKHHSICCLIRCRRT